MVAARVCSAAGCAALHWYYTAGILLNFEWCGCNPIARRAGVLVLLMVLWSSLGHNIASRWRSLGTRALCTQICRPADAQHIMAAAVAAAHVLTGLLHLLSALLPAPVCVGMACQGPACCSCTLRRAEVAVEASCKAQLAQAACRCR